jgi:hypothetical protein
MQARGFLCRPGDPHAPVLYIQRIKCCAWMQVTGPKPCNPNACQPVLWAPGGRPVTHTVHSPNKLSTTQATKRENNACPACDCCRCCEHGGAPSDAVLQRRSDENTSKCVMDGQSSCYSSGVSRRRALTLTANRADTRRETVRRPSGASVSSVCGSSGSAGSNHPWVCPMLAPPPSTAGFLPCHRAKCG